MVRQPSFKKFSILLLTLCAFNPLGGSAHATVTYEQLARALFGLADDVDPNNHNPGHLTLGYTGGGYQDICPHCGLDVHAGIDFRSRSAGGGVGRDPVHAVMSGVVNRAESGTVAVYNADEDVTVLYLHLDTVSVAEEDTIEFGREVGLTGETGAEGAPHLHLEIRNGSQTRAMGGSACGGTCDEAGVLERTHNPLEFLNFEPLHDISDDTWYAKAVRHLYDKKIVQGYPDGSFKPGNQVNRVEFITMLVQAMQVSSGHDLPATGVVPDGAQGTWYYPFLQKAYGYTNADYDNQAIAFWGDNGPPWGQAVTRQEAAHALMNAKGLKAAGFFYKLFHPSYPDVASSSQQADWVYAIRKKGIMEGYPDGTFKPDQILNRAEAAVLLCKAFFEGALCQN